MAQLTVMQRLENLEKSGEEFDQKLNATFDKLRNQVGYVMEVVDALTTVLKEGTAAGQPAPLSNLELSVEAALLAKREARKKDRVDQENKQLANLVEMGVIKPSNT